MRERDFQRTVTRFAELNGWLWYHTFDSRRSNPGFPDLTLVRGGELILAELKTDKGRVTAPQRAWLDQLAEVTSTECHLWRPKSWGEIRERLRRRF